MRARTIAPTPPPHSTHPPTASALCFTFLYPILATNIDSLRYSPDGRYLVVRNDVAALSPYLTSHIKRFGDYLIDLDAVPQALDEEIALTF